MEWFLTHVLSPLLLPIFVLVVLCIICDVKPDTFVKLYLDILQKFFELSIRLLWQALVKIWQILVCVLLCIGSSGQDCGKAPRKKTGVKKRQTSGERDEDAE